MFKIGYCHTFLYFKLSLILNTWKWILNLCDKPGVRSLVYIWSNIEYLICLSGVELGEDEDSVLYFPHHTSLYVRMLLQFFYTGTLYTVHRTLYTVHLTLYTVHCTPYTVHRTPYTVHCTPYSTDLPGSGGIFMGIRDAVRS